jgi:UDP-N-acetylmuramyl pentapeptide phosphotransferase/UDP-N-acetylglucosamine-1-phosphate transferase
VIPFLVAALVVLAVTPLARATGRRLGLVDVPNTRSSHVRPTPRAGGIAIVAGIGVALAVSWSAASADFAALVVGGVLVAAVGILDDRFGLPAWPKLAGQTAAAVLLVWQTGGLERLPLPPPADVWLGPVGGALAVLWVVAVVNFYNFMDGIDGLAAVQGVVTAGALAVVLWRANPMAAALAAAVAGACAAFLVYNWSPASVFLGDAGSGVVGYALAALPLAAPLGERPEAVVLAGTSLFLLLGDATTCLVARLARGERWDEPHRQHVYQRLVDAGVSQARVAGTAGAGAVVLATIALATYRQGPLAWLGLAVGASLFAWAWRVGATFGRGRAPLAPGEARPAS